MDILDSLNEIQYLNKRQATLTSDKLLKASIMNKINDEEQHIQENIDKEFFKAKRLAEVANNEINETELQQELKKKD